MSLIDFWTNVKTASGFINPKIEVDSGQLNSNHLQQEITSAVIWLTPRSVQGFDIDDFTMLPKKEGDVLKESVRKFREVAESVPGNQPAPKESVTEASRELLKIIDLLQINNYENAECYKIAKLLDSLKLKLPDWIEDIKYHFDYDATGDPAVWIWVIANNEEAEKEPFFKDVRRSHDIIRSTLQMHGVKLWPYLSVRTVSEQSDVETETVI